MANTGVKLSEDGRVECLICHQWQSSVRSLSVHVSKGHHMDRVTYYDTYVKRAGEGTCGNPECGKPTRFRTLSDGYAECCCAACFGKVSAADGRVRCRLAKAAETNIKKFGVPNAFQSEECKAKSRETNLAKRGVEYASQSADVQGKCKATNIERYGASTYLHSDEGAAAVREANLMRYGVENGGGSAEAMQKAACTNEAKYGSANPWDSAEFRDERLRRDRERNGGMLYVETDEFKQKSAATQQARYGGFAVNMPDFRAKVAATNLRKYGTEQYFASDDFSAKTTRTNIERYGVENYAQTDEYHDKVRATNLERYGNAVYLLSDDFRAKSVATNIRKYGTGNYFQSDAYFAKVNSRYGKYLERGDCTLVANSGYNSVTFRCNACGSVHTEQIQFIVARVAAAVTPCSTCRPKNCPVSLEETSLGEFIGTLGMEYAHYDRDFLGTYGAEMVFECSKVIIEYDGLYWHSELFREPSYHLQKTLLAEERGYHLVHIFSDEWLYKQDIVKERIRNLLVPDTMASIYARKCKLREVEKPESDAFLDANHLQGACMDSTRLGLYSDGRLVALMTFGVNRFGEGHELIRYCTLGGYRVVGAAGKLFSHYCDMHPEVTVITTYADRRWTCSSGAFYDRIGFVYDGESDPGYYYVNGDVRESRMKYQKHKLVADGADASLTEHEIMLGRGLYRIYDCGNLRYIWKRA